MTAQEAERKVRNEDALEYCKKQSMLEQMVGNETWRHYHYAVKALEEVEQYRALGTVEELKEAREKQIPKKPIEYEDKYYACPRCEGNLMYKWDEYPTKLKSKKYGLPYCLGCGQKLDWSEEDD